MDAVFLSRLQFAVTMGFHFLFPPISIGLGLLLCIAEWIGWRKNDETYVRIGKLFGRLFAITFTVGIASGFVMLFQFGTNWAAYSTFVANIFGAPLAAEGFFAFFLESVFMGLYLFGRGRVSKGAHWFSLLMVALGAATLSAFFIIAANSWQQTPAGYVLVNGRAELTSLSAAIFNPSTLVRYFHVIIGAMISGSFVFAAVGAWHLLKDSSSVLGLKSLRLGIISGLIFSGLAIMPSGHLHAQQVARMQPEKFAAIEGLYKSCCNAPLVIFAIPHSDPPPPELRAKLEVPSLLSLLAFGRVDAPVRGIQEFPPEDRPPLFITFMSFHNMVALANYFIALMAIAAFRLYQGRIGNDRLLLRVLVWSVPLPVICCLLGWVTAEVGRQPWAVYKLLRTSAAASPTVPAAEIAFSLALFSLIYLALFAVWLFLMIRTAKLEPVASESGEE